MGPRLWSFSLALSIFAIDFVSKRIVLAKQSTFLDGIPLIDGVLQFTYVRNAGAAFGMLQGARWPFVAVSAMAVVLLTWLLIKRTTHGLHRIAYALVLAGAAGNLYDRIFYHGLVVDFIEITIAVGGRTFPVFNVADMGVSIGAALLVIALMREDVSERRAAEAEHQSSEDLGEVAAVADEPLASSEADDERRD